MTEEFYIFTERKGNETLTTNKNNCLTKQYLDKNVDGWAVCFCLSPLPTNRKKKKNCINKQE